MEETKAHQSQDNHQSPEAALPCDLLSLQEKPSYDSITTQQSPAQAALPQSHKVNGPCCVKPQGWADLCAAEIYSCSRKDTPCASYTSELPCLHNHCEIIRPGDRIQQF